MTQEQSPVQNATALGLVNPDPTENMEAASTPSDDAAIEAAEKAIDAELEATAKAIEASADEAAARANPLIQPAGSVPDPKQVALAMQRMREANDLLELFLRKAIRGFMDTLDRYMKARAKKFNLKGPYDIGELQRFQAATMARIMFDMVTKIGEIKPHEVPRIRLMFDSYMDQYFGVIDQHHAQIQAHAGHDIPRPAALTQQAVAVMIEAYEKHVEAQQAAEKAAEKAAAAAGAAASEGATAPAAGTPNAPAVEAKVEEVVNAAAEKVVAQEGEKA